MLNEFTNNNSLTKVGMLFYPLIDLHRGKVSAKTITGRYVLTKAPGDPHVLKAKWSYEEWPYKERFIPLKRLRSSLMRYPQLFEHFFVHGSVADGSFIKGFSDTDAILILKEGVIKDEKKIEKARKVVSRLRGMLYLLDPLQHHGFNVVCEEDLKSFEGQFKPQLINDSVSFLGAKEININLNPSKTDFLKDEWFYRRESQKIRRSAYDAKFLVSKIMLLPAIYYQAKGLDVMKKESFDMIRNEFPSLSGVLSMATQLRLDYPLGKLPYLFAWAFHRCSNPWWQVICMKILRTKIPFKEHQKLAQDVFRLFNEMKASLQRTEHLQR